MGKFIGERIGRRGIRGIRKNRKEKNWKTLGDRKEIAITFDIEERESER